MKCMKCGFERTFKFENQMKFCPSCGTVLATGGYISRVRMAKGGGHPKTDGSIAKHPLFLLPTVLITQLYEKFGDVGLVTDLTISDDKAKIILRPEKS